jgi:hypothetical protein
MPSLAASLAALALVAQASAHVSLVAIYGSNGAMGHGFGVVSDLLDSPLCFSRLFAIDTAY